MVINSAVFKDLNAIQAAKYLLGKLIVHQNLGNKKIMGLITEVEAYLGIKDKACHAYGGRKTLRNKVMYEEGGVLYVYLCYGIHYMLNIVCNSKDNPEAVLIRGLYAINNDFNFFISGPGRVTKYLNIDLTKNAQKLGENVFLYDLDLNIDEKFIILSPRIGVDYAEEWAKKLLNFKLKKDYISYQKKFISNLENLLN